MSRNGVLKALAVLTAAYTRDMTDPTIRLYVNGLADLDDHALVGAAEELVVMSKFFPTIAEMREVAVFRMVPGGRPPSAEVAWAEVLDKSSKVGHLPQEFPECVRCDNTRWLTQVDETGNERLAHCSCLNKVIQFPRPPLSHQMIGVAIDACGGYNKLCKANEKERDAMRRLFFKSYNEVIVGVIGKSIDLTGSRPKALPE